MENPSARKASRIDEIEALLLAHPEGMTPAEIARRLNVNRSTIGRYLPDLPKHIYIDDDGRWKIDRSAYLVNIRFTLHEALAVHLASRLLATRMDRQNPHAAAALRKLGIALERLAPRISSHIKQAADMVDGSAQRQDAGYMQVLEALSIGWAEQRKLKVWHRAEQDGKLYRYQFSPYFIEPYSAGQSTHVIGLREPPGRLRTFKVERIERVELLDETYAIPDDFDPRLLLADAWGIWYTEQAPEEVVLQFHPRVAARVRESRWHRSEQVTELANGCLEWRAMIAEPREMLPWLRGWGADVEVVAPLALRNALIQEASRLARLYAVHPLTDIPHARLLRCWGKVVRSERDGGLFHPGIYHMIDVGNVARELLGDNASPRWRTALGRAFGCHPDEIVRWIPYLAALHDIGKISESFQGQVGVQKERLKQEGFPFGRGSQLHHTIIGQIFTFFELADADLPRPLRLIMRDVIGGHHGIFSGTGVAREKRAVLQRDEAPDWVELRREANHLLRSLFLHQPETTSGEPANRSTAVMAMTGFTILCDWLGSDESFFSCQPDMELSAYIELSRNRARQAVQQAGFFQSVTSGSPAVFHALFPQLPSVRPLQAAIDEIPEELLRGPCLAIIEAPTGEGKTEAALALAHRLGLAQGSEEMYYALPTTATSNQMYKRVQQFLQDQLALPANVKLVHSQAFLNEDDLRMDPLENGGGYREQDMLEWFGPKKRALLAPFGVGTIDQAELAALNTKHNALRLLGLSGKVLLLDEVHAYDTYMTTIIERLLAWLSALGTSVIVLSATLPQERRARLLRSYVGVDTAIPEGMGAYPNIAVAGQGQIFQNSPPAAQPGKCLHVSALQFEMPEPKAEDNQKADWLLQQINEGGCACWITNTVDRAQRLFEAVDRAAGAGIERMLIHARFPLDDRQQIENRLVEQYGPAGAANGQRPKRGIVIGTQVLEQSLDLDFDLMVSDIAPVDLLLQRAGRLHRHDRPRPARHQMPHFYIYIKQVQSGKLDLRGDKVIYPEYILLQTWQALENRGEVSLPEDYRRLIEYVYSETPPEAGSPLELAWNALKSQREKEAVEAVQRLTPEPDPIESFCSQIGNLTFEEDENKAGWRIAQTRLGEPSLNVIPLERKGDTAVCIGMDEMVDLESKLPRETQLALLHRSLKISRQEVIDAVLAQNAVLPAMFTESALLKGSYPLWLSDGRTELATNGGVTTLTLDRQLGLVIRKENQRKGAE